jgi:hypothetical protein
MYRDGVSEGQFDEVWPDMQAALRTHACMIINPDTVPEQWSRTKAVCQTSAGPAEGDPTGVG